MINLAKFIMLSVILILIKRYKREVKKDTLLLIRLDAIGDYIMFRNFISELKNNDKFRDYKITLCGNIVWKELAETLDTGTVSDFIWIERLKFLNDYKYKYKVLKDIYNRGFEVAIETIHSREILFGDSIIAASGARIKIGTVVTEKYHRLKKGIFSDHFYTKLIPAAGGIMFEFKRTKEFFSRLLEKNVSLRKPFIDTIKIKKPDNLPDNYIVLFPGASRKEKMWDAGYFKKTAAHIINYTSFQVVTAGSDKEKELCESVNPGTGSSTFINSAGGSLSELAGIIAGAELLISNDTSAIHFAAAAETPFICIANGFYYGRFYPYPEDVYTKGFFLYPPDFIPGKTGDINSVSPEEVISLMNKILKIPEVPV